jgi:hypothetical protein
MRAFCEKIRESPTGCAGPRTRGRTDETRPLPKCTDEANHGSFALYALYYRKVEHILCGKLVLSGARIARDHAR